jgi:hypothetical protein
VKEHFNIGLSQWEIIFLICENYLTSTEAVLRDWESRRH